MSSDKSNIPNHNHNLSLSTPIIFGLQLWVLILISVLLIALFCTLLCLCFISSRRRRRTKFPTTHLPISYKSKSHVCCSSSSMDRRLLPNSAEMMTMKPEVISDRWSSLGSGTERGSAATVESSSSVDATRRGLSVFSAAELEMATNGFADDNVVGERGVSGRDAVFYRGVLVDNRQIAVKRLDNNNSNDINFSCEAEDFEVEMEGMGHVRHKNLVKLLGYSLEGAYRTLVYEYVDNGNLHQWLHNCPRHLSPLTWTIRIKIITGTAKGLAYLHEDLEPKIIHCDIKASKILLDHQWNPKISGFGLAKLSSPQATSVTPRLTTTSGYIAPEYASTGILSEKTDVYSFGVLIMEIISGRKPVDHSQSDKKYLVDWLKSMIADQKAAYVVDPALEEVPSSKELKRILLVALRCVDPDVKNRPKMGDIIHMLQPHDLLLSDEQCRVRRAPSCRIQTEESLTDAIPETGSC